jgi:hypothetical protein
VPLTIVVVDDALDYRLIVRALLAPESEAMIIVGEAANGEEAWRSSCASSYSEDAYRLVASDSGADAFVNKRMVYDALLPAIRDLIGRKLSGESGPPPPSAGPSSAWAAPK